MCTTDYYTFIHRYDLFYHMEDEGLLDIDDDVHMQVMTPSVFVCVAP